MKKQSIVFLLLMAAFILSGCNTVQGVGKDVQRGGEAVEDAAN